MITAKKIQETPIKKENEKIERIFYNFRQAQEFLDISHGTMYQLMKQGLPSHKIGRKRVFLIEDLIRWIKEH
jgi:hypothetical protein